MSSEKGKDPIEEEIETLGRILEGRGRDKTETILKYFLRGLNLFYNYYASHRHICRKLAKERLKKDDEDNEEGPKAEKFESFIRKQGGEELDYESLIISFPPLSAYYDLKKNAKAEGLPPLYECCSFFLNKIITSLPPLSSSSNALVTFNQAITDYIINTPTTSAIEYFLETECSYKSGKYPAVENLRGHAEKGFDLFLALEQGKKQKYLEKEMTLMNVLNNSWNQSDEAAILSTKTFSKLFSQYKPGELFVSNREGLESDKRLAGLKDKAQKAMVTTKNKDLLSELAGMILNLGLARGSLEDLLCVLEVCEIQKVEISFTNIIHKLADWLKYYSFEQFPVGNYKKEDGNREFHHCLYAASNGNFYYGKDGEFICPQTNSQLREKHYQNHTAFCMQKDLYVYHDVMCHFY